MDNNDIIEIYKLHTELSDRISQRRGQSNQFYTTLLTTLMGVIGFSMAQKPDFFFIIRIIAITGILISLVWMLNIRSYKVLNLSKFMILQELEEKMPFQFFKKEYEKIKQQKKYLNQSNVEMIIPFIFAIIFFIILCTFKVPMT